MPATGITRITGEPSLTVGCPAMGVVASAPMAAAERITVSVKLTKATAERLRTFVRDQAGKPLYLEMGTFVEKAINDAIDLLEDGVADVIEPRRQSPQPKVRRVELNNIKRP